jgi:hypothetical protein
MVMADGRIVVGPDKGYAESSRNRVEIWFRSSKKSIVGIATYMKFIE